MLWVALISLLRGLLIAAAAYFLLLSISNVLWLRLASRGPRQRRRDRAPRVSVLIPCRDEESNIGRCLDSLLAQRYEDYEIVALDDESSDSTWEILASYAERYPGRVRAVRGRPLPGRGWYGKPYAMQQLAAQADGEYLLFVDADTVHREDSLAWAVANLERHRADCLSGYVAQELSTPGEMLIVPATYIISAMILPLWLIPLSREPVLSFAIGQVMLFRKTAFTSIGGYSRVAEQISDDVAIAREVKNAGLRLVFLDLRRQVRCRMYRGYQDAVRGLSKNIFDFFRNRPAFFAVALTFLVIFALLPFCLLVLQFLGGSPALPLTALSVGGFQLAWALTLYDRGLRWWVPFLYPVLFVHLLYMAWKSFALVSAGQGVVWKGRVVR
jgi:chlorobactene glucosyltransferase